MRCEDTGAHDWGAVLIVGEVGRRRRETEYYTQAISHCFLDAMMTIKIKNPCLYFPPAYVNYFTQNVSFDPHKILWVVTAEVFNLNFEYSFIPG